MVYNVFFYIKSLFLLSWRRAWDSANNIAGNIVVLLLSGAIIWFWTGILGKPEESMNTSIWLPIILTIILAYPILLLFRMIFIAPYRLHEQQKQEISELKALHEDEKDAWEKRYKSDIGNLEQQLSDKTAKERIDEQNKPASLIEAVRYIQSKTEWGKGKTDQQVIVELLRLASGSTVTISGLYKSKHFAINKHNDTVATKFLSNCHYNEKHGDLATPALIEDMAEDANQQKRETETADVLGWLVENQRPDIYYYPTVMMDEIKRHFDRR